MRTYIEVQIVRVNKNILQRSLLQSHYCLHWRDRIISYILYRYICEPGAMSKSMAHSSIHIQQYT